MTLDDLKVLVLKKLATKFPEPTELIELARTIEEADLCKVDYLLEIMKADKLLSNDDTKYKIEVPGQALLYEPVEPVITESKIPPRDVSA